MKIHVDHTTHYAYDTPVRQTTQYLRLVPATSARQRVIDWQLHTPAPTLATRDGYGNILHLHTVDQPVTEIVIRAAGMVETTAAIDEAPDEVRLSPLVFLRPTALTQVNAPLAEFAEAYRRRAGTVSGLRELAAAVLRRLPFHPGVTDPYSTAADAFAAGEGVCQDHAHVFIACCRLFGIPARYVSGYLFVSGGEQQHIASHAWAEAWVVDRWRSFDVTNNCPAGEYYIRLAVGADYLEACPVRGARRGGGGVEQMTAAALVSTDQ